MVKFKNWKWYSKIWKIGIFEKLEAVQMNGPEVVPEIKKMGYIMENIPCRKELCKICWFQNPAFICLQYFFTYIVFYCCTYVRFKFFSAFYSSFIAQSHGLFLLTESFKMFWLVLHFLTALDLWYMYSCRPFGFRNFPQFAKSLKLQQIRIGNHTIAYRLIHLAQPWSWRRNRIFIRHHRPNLLKRSFSCKFPFSFLT